MKKIFLASAVLWLGVFQLSWAQKSLPYGSSGGGSGSGSPSGAAGGDLGGTYPNPNVVSVSHVTTGVLPAANGGTGVASTSQNFVLAGPTSGSGVLAPRALVAADIPAPGSAGQFLINSGGAFGAVSQVTYSGGQFTSSTQTVVGVDQAHCGALFTSGTTGTLSCAQAGNNLTNEPWLFASNGGACLTVRDFSDTSEIDICNDSGGPRVGPNITNLPMRLMYGTRNVGYRLGGSGNTTVGKLVAQDAGTNAAFYINYPSTAAVGGMMFESSASTQTAANTTKIVLYSFSIPANTLKNNGDCLEFTCGGSGAATATTKDLGILFGSTTLSSTDGTSIADTGAVTANNVSFFAEARVCKNASNVQKLVKTFAQIAGTIATQPASPSLTKTDTAAIIVSCTCQNGTGNNGDCLGNGFQVEYKPAP